MSHAARILLLTLVAPGPLPVLQAADPPPGAAAQQPSAVAPFPEDYLMLLEACRSGQPATTILARESLAGWTGARLAQALAGIGFARAEAAADPGSPARVDDRLLAAAAVVHAELAFGHLDGLQQAAAKAHFDMARGLLELLPEAAPPAGLKARWFLAVGCRHRRDFELDTARAWFRAGLGVQPDDARLLLALGSVDELMATFRNVVCPSAAECPNAASRDRYLGVEWDRQKLVSSAESLYRRALTADPGLSEAQLRLGRLLALHVSKTRGREELRAAQERIATGDLRYLAHLFLGAALEEAGESGEAVAQYHAALALRADAQAARLAVARALRRAGDRAGEREMLFPLLTAPGTDPPDPASEDPWWLYAIGPQVCAESEWRSLSREVGQ